MSAHATRGVVSRLRRAHYGGRVHHLPRAVVALLGVALLASGCAAASSPPPSSAASTPTAQRTLPAGTATMAGLGWKNSPADRIVLPTAATIDLRVDQANVITAIGRPTSTSSVLQTLTQTLPSYGWTITASAGGSLVFEDNRYEGAFTSDSAVWALTIRVKA